MKHACERVSFLVSESLERHLSLRERLFMRFHFLMCGACKHYNHNMLKLHQVLKLQRDSHSDKLQLPEDKRKKIKSILDEVNPK